MGSLLTLKNRSKNKKKRKLVFIYENCLIKSYGFVVTGVSFSCLVSSGLTSYLVLCQIIAIFVKSVCTFLFSRWRALASPARSGDSSRFPKQVRGMWDQAFVSLGGFICHFLYWNLYYYLALFGKPLSLFSSADNAVFISHSQLA